MSRVSRRLTFAAIGAVAALAVVAPVSAAEPGQHHEMKSRWSHSAGNGGGGGNLLYHGGPVETTPAVYISWWGSAWSSGFATGGYTSGQAQTYISNFFSNVGGSRWENIVTQYCQGVPNGTVNCGSSGSHILNVSGQLAGTWNDTSPVPANGQITNTDVANAAIRLAQHFGYNANATYFVLTPSGDSESGFAANGGSWCAWHGVTNYSADGEMAFAYVPYQPDAGASCGMNFVNSTNSAYGNGYFDGFSIVGGHEYAEAETDPFTASGQYAWYDRRGNEIGDKCAWSALSTNITLGSNFYAVQPLWSNANSGCVTSY